jgi:hypothetical protein
MRLRYHATIDTLRNEMLILRAARNRENVPELVDDLTDAIASLESRLNALKAASDSHEQCGAEMWSLSQSLESLSRNIDQLVIPV